MIVYFCNYATVSELKEIAKKIEDDCDLCALSFNNYTPKFLTRYYYIVLNLCKEISIKKNCSVIMPFYIISGGRKFLNLIVVKSKDVVCILGESFTKKWYSIKVCKEIVNIICSNNFYCNSLDKEFLKFNLLIVFDDESGKDYYVLKHGRKYGRCFVLLNKDMYINGNMRKNIRVICKNLCKLNIQKFCKLIK